MERSGAPIDTYIQYGFYLDELQLDKKKQPATVFAEAPTIYSIKELQDINEQWRDKVGLKGEGIDTIAPRLVEEVDELNEAMNGEGPDRKKEIVSELADIGLYVLAMMSEIGVQADEVFSAKVNRNIYKYNPTRVRELIDSGVPQKQAMKQVRGEWNRKDDQEFFKKI